MPVAQPSSWLFSLRLDPISGNTELASTGVCEGEKTIMLGEIEGSGERGRANLRWTGSLREATGAGQGW